MTRLRAGVRANYGLTDKTTLDFTLPFQLIEVEEIGMDEFALADIELGLHRRVVVGSSKVWLGATVALPTGESESQTDDGDLIHGSLQIGRGAADLILSVKSFSVLSPKWSLYGGLISRWGLAENDVGYRYGTVWDATVGSVYSINEADLFCQFLWEYAESDTREGVEAPDTGGHTLYFSPGIRYWVTDNTALTFKTRFRLADNVAGEQMLPNAMHGFGITMSFDR